MLTLRVDGQTRQVAAADLVMWGAPREARRGPQVVVADGSLLVGSGVHFANAQLRLDTTTTAAVALLPRSVVRAVILRPSADRLARAQRRTRGIAQQRDSDELILANGDRVVGEVTSLDATAVAIATDVGAVRIPKTRVGAILLRGPATRPAAEQDARFLIGLRDGTLLRAESLTVDAAVVRVQLVCGVAVAGWQRADLTYLQPLKGRAVYLSDLPASQYEDVPYLTLKWPFRRDQNVLGGQLRCQGRIYNKGLGMHTASRLVYRLETPATADEPEASGSTIWRVSPPHNVAGSSESVIANTVAATSRGGGHVPQRERLKTPFRRFDSDVAVDDAAGRRHGSVLFRVTTHTVKSGWREAYVSPVLRGGDAPVSVSVDLTDADAVRLEVEFADHGDQLDYADWLNPRFVK